MIIGIGCDIVDHELTKKLNWHSDRSKLNRMFSPAELKMYFSDPTIKFLSGRFAAKEAVVKCLGTGMKDGIALCDIHILQSENGKPQILLKGNVKLISDDMQIDVWHISITHSTNQSIAFVIAENRL